MRVVRQQTPTVAMGLTGADKTTPERIGLLVGWSVLLIGYLIALVWYYRRRATSFISARDPILSCLLVISIWLTQSVLLIGDLITPHMWCRDGTAPLLPLSMFGSVGLLSIGCYRCVSLICRYESQRLRLAMKLQEEGFVMELDLNIFQKYLPFFTGRYPPLILAVWTVAVPLWRAIAPVSAAELCEGVKDNALFLASEAVLVFVIAVLVLKVRTVTESLGLVFEMKMQGLLAVLYLFNLGLRVLVFSGHYSGVYHINLMFLEVWFGYVTLGRPVYMSYAMERQQLAPITHARSFVIPPQLATFSGLMASKPGRLSFRQHLQTEFSVENLFFVDDVEAFRSWHDAAKASLPASALSPQAANDDEPDPALTAFAVESRSRARTLYQRYIAAAAPFELNLSANNKRELHAQFRVAKAPPRVKTGGRAFGRVTTHSGDGGAGAGSGAGAAGRYLQPTSGGGSGGAGAVAVSPQNIRVSRSDHKSATARPPPSPGIEITPALSQSGAPITPSAAPVPAPVGRFVVPLPTELPPAIVSARRMATAAEVGGDLSLPMIEDAPRDAAFYVHLFDAAHAEVYHLLITDSYVRYVQSSAFEKLVQQQTLANVLAETPTAPGSAGTTAPHSPNVPGAAAAGGGMSRVGVNPSGHVFGGSRLDAAAASPLTPTSPTGTGSSPLNRTGSVRLDSKIPLIASQRRTSAAVVSSGLAITLPATK